MNLVKKCEEEKNSDNCRDVGCGSFREVKEMTWDRAE